MNEREKIFLKFDMIDECAVINHIDGRRILLNFPLDRVLQYNDQFKIQAEVLHKDEQDCYHLIIPKLDGEFGVVLCVDKDHVIHG